jgi:hypothetical protein
VSVVTTWALTTRALNVVGVVGFFVLGSRSGAEPMGEFASLPAGGLRRIPPKTPHASDSDVTSVDACVWGIL